MHLFSPRCDLGFHLENEGFKIFHGHVLPAGALSRKRVELGSDVLPHSTGHRTDDNGDGVGAAAPIPRGVQHGGRPTVNNNIDDDDDGNSVGPARPIPRGTPPRPPYRQHRSLGVNTDDDDDDNDDGDGDDDTLRLLCDQHYSFKIWSTLPDFICDFFGFPSASGGDPPADGNLRFSPEGGPDSAPSATRSPPLGVAGGRLRSPADPRLLCLRRWAGVATALPARGTVGVGGGTASART